MLLEVRHDDDVHGTVASIFFFVDTHNLAISLYNNQHTLIGSLPGLESVEPADADVKEALASMELQDDGDSRLNFFIQVFRSGDFPIYEDYAVHRNAEGTPYQIIVTK